MSFNDDKIVGFPKCDCCAFLFCFASDALKRNYLLGRYFLEVEMEDLAGFDEMLSDKVHKQPTENLQIFEEAAREVADEITSPRPEGEEEIQDIQILLQSNANPTNIRDLKVSLTGIELKLMIIQWTFFLLSV